MKSFSIITAAALGSVQAFVVPQIPSSTSTPGASQLFSSVLPLDRTATREIDNFQAWAGDCGVLAENGFYIEKQMVDGVEDYYAATSTGAAEGSRVLAVPGEMILSSIWLEQEYEGYIEPCLGTLHEMGMDGLSERFYLFVKILIEYENGETSPYFPWLQAMPRAWNTAVSMDDFCLSCLPPFIKSLCQKERDQFGAFKRALNSFEWVSPETKINSEVLKFAYNVVFTRSWQSDNGDYRIIPVADMLNHGYPDNVVLSYDDETGGCEVYVKEDVQPGEPLTLSYGQPTNPSRFLATYGFLNDAPAFFCKYLISNPSQELIEIGYDPSQMLFFTEDGSIAQEVWDVMLYSRLEKKPNLAHVKEAFYQAHVSGDLDTKSAIHQEYQSDTVGALLRHVNFILIEVSELTVSMNAFDSSKHPRLPLLRKHHEMVTSTFSRVRDYLMSV